MSDTAMGLLKEMVEGIEEDYPNGFSSYDHHPLYGDTYSCLLCEKEEREAHAPDCIYLRAKKLLENTRPQSEGETCDAECEQPATVHLCKECYDNHLGLFAAESKREAITPTATPDGFIYGPVKGTTSYTHGATAGTKNSPIAP